MNLSIQMIAAIRDLLDVVLAVEEQRRDGTINTVVDPVVADLVRDDNAFRAEAAAAASAEEAEQPIANVRWDDRVRAFLADRSQYRFRSLAAIAKATDVTEDFARENIDDVSGVRRSRTGADSFTLA